MQIRKRDLRCNSQVQELQLAEAAERLEEIGDVEVRFLPIVEQQHFASGLQGE